jgi:hypothetical protein
VDAASWGDAVRLSDLEPRFTWKARPARRRCQAAVREGSDEDLMV